jgi:murein DD-endopeptidase MepM/ murein hydrolase activator NlpD/N-acetylneuraminic acid mutarotase
VKFLHKALFLLILLKIFTLFIGESVGIAHATQAENWQKTKNNMLINHQFPAVASLSDGKALVVGAGSSSANSAEIYDPSNDNWELTNSLARSMFANTATTLNDGKVLVAGFGFSTSGSNPVSSQIYNPANNTWSLAGNMQKVRYFHQASLLNDGRILATGGINNNTGTASAEAYNPSTNQWTTAPSMNAARYGHRSNTLNDGRVLITGGGTSTSYLKSVDIYNPTVNTWTQAKPMSTQRFGHTATLLPNGKVLVTGGIGSGDPLASTEIFDPTNNTWTPANSMNASRLLHAATLRNDGKVLVTGGISRQAEGYTITNTTEIYDPATNTWIQGPYMISPRSYHATTELTNGHVLAVGGVSDINKINEWNNSAELLLPGGAPVPFLDLPWDYENKGLNFNDAALEINSYFDHEYPLLGSGLSEPSTVLNTIVPFLGFPQREKPEFWYSKHDGYDYGIPANVRNGDPVLPAAPGIAEYVYDRAGGNAIFIDHGNGYQTRYYHLQGTGLIVNKPGIKVPVDRSTVIGKVGSTGNHTTGPHIHIGVFQDKNGDGNFNDNVPDGATDPYGWQSTDPDPWENFSFFQNGVQKKGNKSYYLWKHKLDSLRKELSANGGIFTIGRTKLTFSNDINLQGVLLEAQASPSVKASDSLVSLGSTIDVILKDPLGTLITVLTKPMIITINFSQADLSRFKPGTISIYSSTDRKVWKKEDSFVDFLNKQATAEVDHLTYFALMGERIDTVAPTTTATLSGTQGEESWYRSDGGININAQDNEGGLGVDNTQYKIDDEDWQPYSVPFSITEEGHHKIQYYSQDNDGNLEDVKTVEFDIDKTVPEAKIQFDLTEQELVVSGLDSSGQTNITKTSLSKSLEQVLITDKAGNTLLIEDTDRAHGPNSVLSLQTLSYNGETFLMDKNKFSIRYQEDKTGEIKSLVQVFEIRGQVKVKLDYDPKKNKTTITQDKQKTEVGGIKILQLTTEKGTIKYSY